MHPLKNGCITLTLFFMKFRVYRGYFVFFLKAFVIATTAGKITAATTQITKLRFQLADNRLYPK